MNPRHLLLALLVVFVWGLNFVAIRLGLNGVPPLFLVFLRFFLASIPAVFFIKKPTIPFHTLAMYSLITFVLQFSFLFIGISLGVAPGLASLITQTQVFFTIILGIVFVNERPNSYQYIGCTIALIGLSIVLLHMNGTITLKGFLFLLGAAFFWSFGNLISKKIGKVSNLSLVTWASLIAWPPLLAVSLTIEGYDQILYALTNLTWISTAATLYITYFSTLLGYSLWSYLTLHLPLSLLASFTILIPIVAMLSSILFLNEPLQPWKITAAILVLTGLGINLFAKKLLSTFRGIGKA